MEEDLERRLRSVDQRAQHVAAQRRHYDATAVPTSSGLVGEPPHPQSALGLAAATKSLQEDFGKSGGTGGNGDNAPGLVGVAPCPRCQSMDVSLNILRTNVASVEEGYLDQIDAMGETLAVVEAERDELLKRSTMYHHEAELQHANSLKRGIDVSTLRRDLVRLETENETLGRQLYHTQMQLGHQTKFSAERESLQITNEEAAARSSISLMEQCWWEVSAATWSAQRGADKKLAQAERQLLLRMRLENNSAGVLGSAIDASVSESPLKAGEPMSSFVQQEFQATGRAMAELSGADGLGNSGVYGTEALQTELREVDLKFNQALASELKGKKELAMAKHEIAQLQTRAQTATADLLTQCEDQGRQDLMKQFLIFHNDATLKRSATLREAGEKQRNFAQLEKAGKDKEISTLRRMLMEAKEEANTNKKAVTKLSETERQLMEAESKIATLQKQQKTMAVAQLQANQARRDSVKSSSSPSEEEFFVTGGRLVAPLDSSEEDLPSATSSDDESPLPRILGAPHGMGGAPGPKPKKSPQEILKEKQAEFLAKKAERDRLAKEATLAPPPPPLTSSESHPESSLRTPPESFFLGRGGASDLGPLTNSLPDSPVAPAINQTPMKKKNRASTACDAETQTALGEVDLVEQLRELMARQDNQQRGGGIAAATTPRVESDQVPSGPLILDRGDPIATLNIPSKTNVGSVAGGENSDMQLLDLGSASPNNQSTRMLETLNESVQDLKVDFEMVLTKISGDTGYLLDTINDSVGSQREDHAAAMSELSDLKKTIQDKKLGAEDLNLLKTSLKNLIISVSHHQKKVHESVKTVSQTLTGIQTDIHTVKQDNLDVQSGVRSLDASLLRAVERQMSIERVGSTTNNSALTKQAPSTNAPLETPLVESSSTGRKKSVTSPLVPEMSNVSKQAPSNAPPSAAVQPPKAQDTWQPMDSMPDGGRALSPVSHAAASHNWDEDSDDDEGLPPAPVRVRQAPAPPKVTSVVSGTGAKKFNITPFDDDSDDD